MGRCACNTSSVTKYRNSRIISDILLAGHLFFDKKIFDIANSTIGKASKLRVGWESISQANADSGIVHTKKSCELWSWAKSFLLHHHKSSFAPWYKYPSMFNKAAIIGKQSRWFALIYMYLFNVVFGFGLETWDRKKIRTNVEWPILFSTCSMSPLEEKVTMNERKRCQMSISLLMCSSNMSICKLVCGIQDVDVLWSLKDLKGHHLIWVPCAPTEQSWDFASRFFCKLMLHRELLWGRSLSFSDFISDH